MAAFHVPLSQSARVMAAQPWRTPSPKGAACEPSSACREALQACHNANGPAQPKPLRGQVAQEVRRTTKEIGKRSREAGREPRAQQPSAKA